MENEYCKIPIAAHKSSQRSHTNHKLYWWMIMPNVRTSYSQMLLKIGVLENFAEFTIIFRQSFRFQFCNLIKKETPTQLICCKFCEIFQNAFFIE